MTALQELKSIEKFLCQYSEINYTVDCEAAIDTMRRREKKLKEEIVLEAHPYKISSLTKIKNGKNYSYFSTRLKGSDAKATSSTYFGLIEKLYDIYFPEDDLKDERIPDFKKAFELMIAEKEKKNATERLTITHNRSDFNRYIAGRRLSEKEIRAGKIQFEQASFLDRKMDCITKKDLLDFYEELVGDRRITEKTFNNVKSVINEVFAYVNNHDGWNCIVSKELNTRYILRRCKQENNSDKVYSNDERKCLLDYLDGLENKTVYSLAIELMFCTTCRISELRALRWSDIDFENRKMHLCHQIADKPDEYHNRVATDVDYMKSRAKSGVRTLGLSSYALKILNELKEINGDAVYVLKNTGKEDRPIYTNRFNENLQKFCKAAGVPYHSSHAIRFTACSNLYAADIDEIDIQRSMGHSCITTTRHYDRRQNKELSFDTVEKVFGCG